MPEQPAWFQQELWSSVEYILQTGHGYTKQTLKSTPTRLFNGMGIGSGLAPNLWLGLFDVILDLMDEKEAGINNEHPMGLEATWIRRMGDAFVNNNPTGVVNVFAYITEIKALLQLEEDIDVYNGGLWVSGGTLQFLKCHCYMADFH